jgi:hypothetical protein
MINFKTGDRVRATYQGRSVNAVVWMASENGRSIVIDWMSTDDGMLGGFAGVMPIYRLDDGLYVSLIEGDPVTLEMRA